MKNLQEQSGIDIKIEGDILVYNHEQFPSERKARTFKECHDVYLDETDPNKELYFMYRRFEEKTKKGIFEDADIEYDITIITTGKIGEEPIKTKGHYHPLVPGTNISYPEVYEVIDGDIEYVLQTKPNENNETDVVIVRATTGDKVIIPPNYGHVSINYGHSVAAISNLQKRNLPAGVDYVDFEEYHGAAVYRTENGWRNDPNYIINSIKHVKPMELPRWGLFKNKSLYLSFLENPEDFKWLTEPQKYDFSDIWEETN